MEQQTATTDDAQCPYCNSTDTTFSHAHEDGVGVAGGVDDGANVRKCNGCLSYYVNN